MTALHLSPTQGLPNNGLQGAVLTWDEFRTFLISRKNICISLTNSVRESPILKIGLDRKGF